MEPEGTCARGSLRLQRERDRGPERAWGCEPESAEDRYGVGGLWETPLGCWVGPESLAAPDRGCRLSEAGKSWGSHEPQLALNEEDGMQEGPSLPRWAGMAVNSSGQCGW